MNRIVLAAFSALLLCSPCLAAEVRTAPHTNYAKELWTFLQGANYQTWEKEEALDQPFGPPACHEGATYANSLAVKSKPEFEYGSLLITENKAEGSEETASVTVFYRVKEGFDAKRNDWYWSIFTPSGNIIKTSADKNAHDQRGYFVQEDDGRLWVFHIHSADLGSFLEEGDLAKRVTRIGAGPNGETLMSGENQEIDGYLKTAGVEAPPTEPEPPSDDPAPELTPANPDVKQVPADSATNNYDKPGFTTMEDDGRLWVFKTGSEDLAAYKESGDLAKRVTRIGAGPEGMTLMAPDADVLDAYLLQKTE